MESYIAHLSSTPQGTKRLARTLSQRPEALYAMIYQAAGEDDRAHFDEFLKDPELKKKLYYLDPAQGEFCCSVDLHAFPLVMEAAQSMRWDTVARIIESCPNYKEAWPINCVFSPRKYNYRKAFWGTLLCIAIESCKMGPVQWVISTFGERLQNKATMSFSHGKFQRESEAEKWSSTAYELCAEVGHIGITEIVHRHFEETKV